MESLTELRKRGVLKLANGGKLTRVDNRTAIYEAAQKIRVELPLDEKTVEAATADKPMFAVFQSLLGIDCADLAKRVARLTPREMQVFEQLGTGRKGEAVAEEFGISPKTLDITSRQGRSKAGSADVEPYRQVVHRVLRLQPFSSRGAGAMPGAESCGVVIPTTRTRPRRRQLNQPPNSHFGMRCGPPSKRWRSPSNPHPNVKEWSLSREESLEPDRDRLEDRPA